jgi:signal transduction histidine kinase
MPDWRHGPLKFRAAWVIAATAAVVAACWCIRLCGLVNSAGNSLAVEVSLLVLTFLTGYALGYETGLPTGLTGVAALIAATQAANGAFTPLELMFTLGPWAAGRVMRSRRRLLEQLRASNDELQAQQEAYAAEVVRYERSRIAADLHDLVGHALSLMVVQAGAGQRAARDREDRARIALEHAGEAAREAQAEVRAVAGLLAGQAAAGVPGVPDGLGLVAEIVRQARQAGIDMTYRLAGPGGSGNAEAEAAAGRIVTEALTNALKHAPGAPVTLEVRTGGGSLEVTIENGPGRGNGNEPGGLGGVGGGHGLAGLRQRAATAGGRLSAGPVEDGGWRVHAVFPAKDGAQPDSRTLLWRAVRQSPWCPWEYRDRKHPQPPGPTPSALQSCTDEPAATGLTVYDRPGQTLRDEASRSPRCACV